MLRDLQQKKVAAMARIRRTDGLVVALSGGVDSAVLLALAIEALGSDRVLAATGRSVTLSEGELEDARGIAGRLGARHVVLDTHEIDRDGYRKNDGDRCFHCRTELFERLGSLARREGLAAVAYGAIVDDLGDIRPGMRAAAEHGVLAPLLDAGLHKQEVRALAAALALPVHDKPAAACLASRIPTGTAVTPERIAQVDRAESGLKRLGLRQIRVRHHGEIARIETDAEGLRVMTDPAVRASVIRTVHDAGFRYVTLDLEGYRAPGNDFETPLHRIEPARAGGQ